MSDHNAPTYHGHRQRLRQRFLRSGLVGFHDYEIVELILTLAIPRSDVKQPAKELIARFGNLRGILDAPLDALSEVKGIGSVTPVALKIVREVAALYLQQNAEGAERLADMAALANFRRMRIGAAERSRGCQLHDHRFFRPFRIVVHISKTPSTAPIFPQGYPWGST